MKKLPIEIQTFQKIREDDYVYADKTDLAVQLIDHFSTCFYPGQGALAKAFFWIPCTICLKEKKSCLQGWLPKTAITGQRSIL